MRCPAPIRSIQRPRAVVLAVTVLLGPVAGGCDWPAPPRVTIPPPVTWSADANGTGPYLVPVEGEIVDPFRSPSHAYGPGNRGIEYHTEPGAPVRAAQAGRVAFVGHVAGRLVVAVEHSDGRRTTYTGLAAASAPPGEGVAAGQRIGTAGTALHFGVKVGDAYLDPALLFGPAAVALLPDSPGTD